MPVLISLIRLSKTIFFLSSPIVSATSSAVCRALKKSDEKIEPKDEAPVSIEKYSIQVGAFANINNAKQLIKKIKAKKYKTDLIRKIINGKDLNIVMVGSYKSLDEAIKAQNRINKEFKVDGKIIKLAE